MQKETINNYIGRSILMPHGEVALSEIEKVTGTKSESDNIDYQIMMGIASGLNNEQNYDTLTKEELRLLCIDKDVVIDACIRSLKENPNKMFGKKDIMELYACESNKALRILKLMFQMGYGNKIGKEYYVSQKGHEEFVKDMIGKEVYI